MVQHQFVVFESRCALQAFTGDHRREEELSSISGRNAPPIPPPNIAPGTGGVVVMFTCFAYCEQVRSGRRLVFSCCVGRGHRTVTNFDMSLMQVAGLKTDDQFGQLDAQLKDLDRKGPLAELMV